MQRPPRAHARVGAHVARVADHLVDVEEVALVGDDEQRRVVRVGDEPLERAARRGAELEPVDDVEAELDQTGAEVEAPAAVLHQVAARMQRPHEPMRAASRQPESFADLRDREPLRLGREQLEHVERPIGGLDRRRNRQAPTPDDSPRELSAIGGKSSYSQIMIVTPPLAKFGTSASAAAISSLACAASNEAASSK